ncbi:uncharacterized protein LOC120605063 isoform X4 [Pteropus medius]|uniref:uncharacterized protein LOC120605063 isoform X4 n=1 Tax=Pteropus vampyrus TaxID=132908 RepID=UPI00196A8317|nr:uncharacterized protein LOC120605063 isoform X4 [Pteropus giganteus]
MVRWHGSALPGDAERVCVYVGHPALPARNQGPPHSQHLKQIDRCFSFFLQPPLPPVLVHALPGTGSTSPSPPEKNFRFNERDTLVQAFPLRIKKKLSKE